MLNLFTINVFVYKYQCIKTVNTNTKTNNHTCILTTRAYIQCIGTVCTLFVSLSLSLREFHRLLRAPATKCPRDETTGDELHVPAMKRQATRCTRDEMAGDEVYPRRIGWRRNVPVTKRRRRNGSDKTSCSGIVVRTYTETIQ